MARRKPETPAGDPAEEASFDETLAELERVVEAMEHEQLGLEELVRHFEKGNALLDRCETVLKTARERIELITLTNRREIGLESGNGPEQAPELSPPALPPDDSDDDDDIRLF